jgi:hypothetical protein
MTTAASAAATAAPIIPIPKRWTGLQARDMIRYSPQSSSGKCALLKLICDDSDIQAHHVALIIGELPGEEIVGFDILKRKVVWTWDDVIATARSMMSVAQCWFLKACHELIPEPAQMNPKLTINDWIHFFQSSCRSQQEEQYSKHLSAWEYFLSSKPVFKSIDDKIALLNSLPGELAATKINQIKSFPYGDPVSVSIKDNVTMTTTTTISTMVDDDNDHVKDINSDEEYINSNEEENE